MIIAPAAFIAFVVLQIILFRRIDHRDMSKWFLLLLVSIGVVAFLTGGLVSFVIFFLAACEYFMGVFGLLATSVRIRLLNEVAGAGEKGISFEEIVRNYPSREIIEKRLERLLASRDLTLDDGKYRATQGITFFKLPALLLSLMKRMYVVSSDRSL